MSSFKAGTSNVSPPAAKSSTVRGAHMNDGDSVGVGSGLSALSGFDAESAGPMVDYEKDGLTGNATERLEPVASKSVSSKGNKFDLC